MHKRVSACRAKTLSNALRKSAGPETHGLTPNHRRVVFYDLETSIVSKARRHEPFSTNIKGMKRRNLIVEIGAVDMNIPGVEPYSSTFHRLVDPRLRNMTLAETLQLTNQNVHRTLMYWNKLFNQKKMIVKQSKSTPVEEQLAVFEDLFDSSEFVTTKRALSQFIGFCLGRQQIPDTPILVAHCGKGFDHQIVRGFCHRLHLPQFGNYMLDSLPAARRILPRLKSHSLGNLHNKLRLLRRSHAHPRHWSADQQVPETSRLRHSHAPRVRLGKRDVPAEIEKGHTQPQKSVERHAKEMGETRCAAKTRRKNSTTGQTGKNKMGCYAPVIHCETQDDQT